MDSNKENLKQYLQIKLQEAKHRIKSKKRKAKVIKILYYSTTTTSIILNCIVVATASLTALPVSVVIILPTCSGILTAISSRFKFKDKKVKIEKEIEKLNKLQAKLDFVLTCNGSLTREKCKEIMEEI